MSTAWQRWPGEPKGSMILVRRPSPKGGWYLTLFYRTVKGVYRDCGGATEWPSHNAKPSHFMEIPE